jgi:hypothetical protein
MKTDRVWALVTIAGFIALLAGLMVKGSTGGVLLVIAGLLLIGSLIQRLLWRNGRE